ncbi:hypothetical protein [Paraflavitalea pollutisoli]|uniref:hypothetical protein n=1 Tax=Paraflavitalea pollutisoli TaxID=3034143 RepID=UPI0023EAC23B|nr:hypothetical protein [Paraflavitalea sp. H1-2-19X]
MKPSKIRHFWEWFERHHQTFLDFESLTRTERQYWLAELDGHLAVYNRFLMPLLEWDTIHSTQKCQLTITAVGRSRSFAMVDKLMKQAPKLRNWEMTALEPAAGFDETAAGMLQQLNASVGKLWFDVRDMDARGKDLLFVFAEGDADIDYDHHFEIDELVYRILGEKVYGTCFGGIRLEAYESLVEEEQSYLVPLEQLPEYVKRRHVPGMTVTKGGRLQRKA